MRRTFPLLRRFASFALFLPYVLGSPARGVEPVEPNETEAGDAPSHSATSWEESERWVPGLSIFGMYWGQFQDRSGSIESCCSVDFPAPAGEAYSGTTEGVFAILGLSAELSTPVLSWVPGRPRLFLHGDAALSFDTEESLVNHENPGPIKIQEVLPGGAAPLEGSQGRGSATRVKTQSPVLSAGLGLTFELPLWDRALRIKPSVEWQWQKDRVRQLFGDAEVEVPGIGHDVDGNPVVQPTTCGPCRTVFVDLTQTMGFHSLGPGLEIEVDAARFGDLMLSVYTFGRAYKLLGSRRLEFENVAVWEVEGGGSTTRAPTTVTSVYERDPWHYAVGIGVRFLWRPE